MPVGQVTTILGTRRRAPDSRLAALFAKGKRRGDPGFPKKVFVVHGDPAAQLAIAPKISNLGFTPHVPTYREKVTLA